MCCTVARHLLESSSSQVYQTRHIYIYPSSYSFIKCLFFGIFFRLFIKYSSSTSSAVKKSFFMREDPPQEQPAKGQGARERERGNTCRIKLNNDRLLASRGRFGIAKPIRSTWYILSTIYHTWYIVCSRFHAHIHHVRISPNLLHN